MPPPQERNNSVPTIGESSRLRRRPAVVLRAPTNAVAIYCGTEQVITAENICEADYDAYRPWNVSILPEPERTAPSASPSPRKRETRSNGCGAQVHGSVVMMRRGACWYGGREELAHTVIPLERGYFPRDMVMALDLRDEGYEVASCGCRVSGLGCAVCGNPLGAVQSYCAAHSARPDFTPAPASYSFSPSAVTPASNATTSEQQNATTSDRPTWDSQIQIADTLTLTPTPASPRALPFIPPLASPPTPTPASPTTFPSSPSTPGYISFIPPTTSYVPMPPRSMTTYTQPTTMARMTAPPTHPPWYGSELATAIMTGAGARLLESESESAERSTVQRAASSSSIVATNANANTGIAASNGLAADGRTPRPRPPPHRRRTLRRPGSVERYLASSSGSGSGSGGEADAAPSTSAYTSTSTSAPSTSPSTYTSTSGAWFPHPFPQPLPSPQQQQQTSALDAPSSSFQADLQRNVMQILRNGEGDADAGAAAGGGGLPVWGYSGTRRGPGSIAPSWAASGAGADADEEGWEPYPMFSRLLDSGAPGEGAQGFEIPSGDTPMPFFHTFPDPTATPTTTTSATTSTTAAPDVYPDRDTLREIRAQLPPVRPPPRPSMFLSTTAAGGGFPAFSPDAEGGGLGSDTRSVYPVPPGAFDAWHSTPDPPPRWGPGTGFVTNTAMDARGVEMQIQMMDAQRLAAQDELPETRAMRILAEQRAAGGSMRGVMGGMGVSSNNNAFLSGNLPPAAANTGTGTSRGAPSSLWVEHVLASARASAAQPSATPRLPGRETPAVPILPRVRVREAQARDARTELLISARTALAEERSRLSELHGRLSALAAAAAERERPTSSSSSALASDVSPPSSAPASESISAALASSSSSTPAPTASAPLVAEIRALVQAQAALLSRVSGLIDGMGARVAGLEGIVAAGGSVETVIARARDTLERAGTGTAAGAGPARLADELGTGMGMEELRAMEAEARRLVAEARRAAAALTAGVSQGQEQDSTSASQAGTRSGAAPPADEEDKRPRPRTNRRIFFER